MLLTQVYLSIVSNKLGTDTLTLAHATFAPTVCPILNNVSPTALTAKTDLTLSNATCLPVEGVVGNQDFYFDPVSLKYQVEVKPPEDGWKFLSDAPDEDFQIYGFALLAGPSATLIGMQMFETPIQMYAGISNQRFDFGPVRFSIPDTLGE